jgi:hypothetical protein
METLTFTVTGANPQTYTTSAQINVDSNGVGSGTATFLYIGNNAGNDTVVATLTSQNGGEGSPFTSNQAGVAFQAVSGPIAVGPITLQIWPNQGDASSNGYFQNPNGTPPSQTLTVNSIMQNPYPESWLPGYSNIYGSGNGAALYPPVVPIVTAQGTWSGSNTVLSIVTSFSNGRAQLDWTGSFVVSAAGTYTFYADSADGTFLGIGGGVTYGPVYAFPPNSGGVTPLLGLPIVMCTNMSGSNQSSISQSITFPAPGIYPFEATSAKAAGSNYYCNYIYSSGMLNPVNIVGSPSGTPANGQLQLTPTGGNSNIFMQGQQGALTLQITGIQYPTANYLPILEGVVGGVFIFNSPTSNVFTVDTFNGLYLADYSPLFTITGDNGAWQGLITIAGDSTTYSPNTVYRLEATGNGGAVFPSGVQLTNLTITLPDIAWYNPGSNYDSVPTGGTDEFQVSSSGGGKVFNIPLYYLLNPNLTPSGAVFSLSPSSIPGNGSTQNFTVTLARPLPPLQNGTLPNVFWAGVNPSAVSAFAPQINSSNGFLYGWTFSAAFPIQSSTVVATMTIQFITPTITYAGQWSFITTDNFTYPGQSPTAQITITASNAQPPYNASFTEIDPTSYYEAVSAIGSFGPNTIFLTSFYSYVANCNGYSVYAYPVVNGVAGSAVYLGGGVGSLSVAPQSNGQFLYYSTDEAVETAPQYPTNFAHLTPQGLIILQQWQFGYTATFSDGQSISYIDPGVYYAFVE